MAPFDRKLSAEQRKLIYQARFEHGQTYTQITRRVLAGELGAGEPVQISPDYVGRICRAEEKKRHLRFSSPLADKPHRDAIEELRRGLIAAADDMLTDYRRLAKRSPAKADVARGREIARLIREAAAIPAKKEDTPAAPGQKTNGTQTEGPTRSGVGGALLTAMRQSATNANRTEPDHDATRQDEDHAHNTHAAQAESGGAGSLTHPSATGLAA